MKKMMKLVILMILGSMLAPGFMQRNQTENVLAVNEKDSRVQRMLREINQFRSVSGLKPMTYNESYAQFEQKVAEKNAKNKKLQHSSLEAQLVAGDVMVMESLSYGYEPEESIWAYISDKASTMGHCHSLLVPDRATIGIGLSGVFGSLIVSSSSQDMEVAYKVCNQLNQKPLSEVKAYIWQHVPSVNYQAHVQNIGWQGYVKDGGTSGTLGKGLRVESFRMNLSNPPVAGDISYATHVQNIGWQAPSTNNQISGTTGQSLRMEAMRINLTGEIAKQYDIYYRTHIQNFGWLGWVKNGQEAGSEGRGLRMEAIEVKLVKKGDAAPKVGGGFITKQSDPSVNYQTHVQNIGWQSYMSDGQVAGTQGRGLRVESFRMNLSNLPVAGDISYAAHVQNIGWQSPSTNNQISGTTGQSLRMEAMRINLTGEIAKQYDVYYRTHVQNYGWLGWAKNGQSAGSEGQNLRMEAIEIKLVKKGAPAPVSQKAFLRKNGTFTS